jgi:HD-like signal output (HDOD) protein
MSSRPLLAIDLRKILAGAQLPALPQSAIRLLELSQDPSKGPAEFAVPIETDPGLAGQVLRFVNSSYFGFTREISSVKLAIALVGVRTIKNFALWSAVFSLMPNPKCGPFDLKRLWQDSLRRALFARAAAKILGVKEAEEAFSAALLQDMAVPLLAKELPDFYVKLLAARDQGRLRLSALEHHAFGWTHAQAAAVMARQWNLPDDFAFLIENHLAADVPNQDGRRDPRQLAVAMSALLPAVADPNWYEGSRLETLFDKIRPAGAVSLPQLLAQVDDEFAGFAPLLKVSLPEKSLIDCYVEIMAPAAP